MLTRIRAGRSAVYDRDCLNSNEIFRIPSFFLTILSDTPACQCHTLPN